MPRDLKPEHRSWILQRQYALTPRQMALAYLTLSVPTLLMTSAFVWHGYWLVLAYAVLELSAVGAALLHCARHAGDYDRIELGRDSILIEQRRARSHHRQRLDLWSIRLTLPQRDNEPIRLQNSAHSIELGALAAAARRALVAQELARYLPMAKDIRDIAS